MRNIGFLEIRASGGSWEPLEPFGRQSDWLERCSIGNPKESRKSIRIDGSSAVGGNTQPHTPNRGAHSPIA